MLALQITAIVALSFAVMFSITVGAAVKQARGMMAIQVVVFLFAITVIAVTMRAVAP